MLRITTAVAFALLWACVSPAAITHTFGTGAAHETDGISGIGTSSADMVGMEVSVVFDSGATDVQTWTSSGIATSDWTITQGTGSTYSSPFQLTNLSNDPIVSFRMHGGMTDTLFNVDAAAATVTSGSEAGRSLIEFGSFVSSMQDVEASYFDAIALTGDAPIGDIYAGLEVSFETGFANQTFSFLTDTDTASSLISPMTTAVPEPSAFVLLSSLVGFGLIRRKRRPTA